MHLALRPYVTTGVAVVGASVIAASPIAPITPADVQIPNPAVQVVEREVQLSARQIEDAVNAILYAYADGAVSIAQLATPLVARILDQPEPIAAATIAALVLALNGPGIGAGGGVGHGLQDLVESETFEDFLINALDLIGLPIDGLVNGQQGPDLGPILGAPFTVLTGGLMNTGGIGGTLTDPILTLPGTIPALQQLITQLLGSNEAFASLALAEEDSTIEDGVNNLLYAATAVGLRLVTLAAPLVAPILDVSEEEAAQFLAIGALGFAGPLISGTGAFGHAVQDLVNSDSSAEFLSNSLDLFGLPVKGAVNGGFGPNLKPLLDLPPAIPLVTGGCTVGPGPGCAVVTDVYAPGLIQNPDYAYDPALQGLGLQLDGVGTATPTATLTTPGTIPTLQGLVTRVFGANETMALRTSGGDNARIASVENSGDNEDAEKDTPKRNRPLLNLVRQSLGADEDGAKKVGASDTGRHRIGTPVRDLINKVVNGGKDKGDKDDDSGDDSAAE